MRTTIEIPDDLFREVKIRAIKEGVRLKELVVRYVAEGLSNSEADTGTSASKLRNRSKLPIARPATGKAIPHLTNAQMYQLLEAEETGALNADAD